MGCMLMSLPTRKPWLAAGMAVALTAAAAAAEPVAAPSPAIRYRQALGEYFEEMSAPRPVAIKRGAELADHRRRLQGALLECVGLHPLPERIPLDVQASAALDHPWCTVRRVWYQLWPGVYTSGLLYLPKSFAERPAPAMLCPHGHWDVGHQHPDVQKRCLNFARLGYVVLSPTQNHYEDLPLGISHQTLMIWTNMRGLDYLESLPDVDGRRLGVAGESGGGLQAQMLVALDPRPKAATIVGLTCHFREIMFPDATHCTCNHFPGVLRVTDHPEISTLGLPAAIQYLTMNDWTATFEKNAFPAIRELYAANGVPDRVFCRYAPTDHNYDQAKRELTYWWMQRWVRGREDAEVTPEPQTLTFPVKTLQDLLPTLPANKGFAELRRLYQAAAQYQAPRLSTSDELRAYQAQQRATLVKLLGDEATLPRRARPASSETADGDLVIQSIEVPSEANLLVPAFLVRPKSAAGKLPVQVLVDAQGRAAAMTRDDPEGPHRRAAGGVLVVVPDVRCFGDLAATGNAAAAAQRQAWERNGIVWGRPVPGMGCTDLRAVLDAVLARSDVDPQRVEVIARGSGEAALVALFAAALDERITAADVDFAGCCFANRKLPSVPFVLRHGDVLQWAALVAPRKLALRNVPAGAGDGDWLAAAYTLAGTAAALDKSADSP